MWPALGRRLKRLPGALIIPPGTLFLRGKVRVKTWRSAVSESSSLLRIRSRVGSPNVPLTGPCSQLSDDGRITMALEQWHGGPIRFGRQSGIVLPLHGRVYVFDGHDF